MSKSSVFADMASVWSGGTDGQVLTYDASGDSVVVGPGTDGQVLTSAGAGAPPVFEAAAAPVTKIAILFDEKTNGTSPPTSTTDWSTRVLNTTQQLASPNNIVSLSNSEFTILNSGTYIIHWWSPGFADGNHFQSRLVDITNSDTVLKYSQSGAASGHANYNSYAKGVYIHSPSGANTYKIEQKNGAAYLYGFGRASSMGGTEIYTTVIIQKI